METIAFLTEQFLSFLTDIINDVLAKTTDFIEKFFTDINWINDTTQINDATSVVMGISITFLVFMTMKQLLSVYVLESNGDADMDPMQLFVKVAISIALISTQPFISNSLIKAADLIYGEIMKTAIIDDLNLVDAVGLVLETSSIANSILSTIFVIFVVLLIVKAMKRAIDLAFFKILFPLFCVDLVTTGNERFNSFITAYLVTVFGYIMQVLCFRLSIVILVSGSVLVPTESMLKAIILLSFAIKAPTWLEKFTYSTGVGKATAGGIKSAANLGMQIFKVVK